MYLGDDAHGLHARCDRSCSVLLGRFVFRRYALPGMTGWKRHLANVREVIEIIEAFNMTYTCVPRGAATRAPASGAIVGWTVR
jgi:hypothetical protein